MVYDFSGKVVIVTGSSQGIGAETVISFSKSGAQVVIADINEVGAKNVAIKCKEVSPKGLAPLVIVSDVAKDDDCIKIINETIKTFGKINVLVNNAGIICNSNLSSDDIMIVYERIMNTNLRSVLLLTKLSIEHLEKTKGVIVNVSSIASKVGSTICTTYCMAKSAIDSLTQCAALELGPKGIRVVSIK